MAVRAVRQLSSVVAAAIASADPIRSDPFRSEKKGFCAVLCCSAVARDALTGYVSRLLALADGPKRTEPNRIECNGRCAAVVRHAHAVNGRGAAAEAAREVARRDATRRGVSTQKQRGTRNTPIATRGPVAASRVEASREAHSAAAAALLAQRRPIDSTRLGTPDGPMDGQSARPATAAATAALSNGRALQSSCSLQLSLRATSYPTAKAKNNGNARLSCLCAQCASRRTFLKNSSARAARPPNKL